MENKPVKIVIELPPEKAAQLYERFKDVLAKEEALRLSLEFSEMASLPIPAPAHPEDKILQTVILEVKALLSTDLDKALNYLGQKLKQNSELHDDWVKLSARYNRVKKAALQQTIDFHEAEQEYAKIDTAIIYLANGLQREHLR
ncbi:MAG: hypothetical protein KIS77_18615 [Saprospiraceae bacterium]|nr:hypothetical protein [Saprospiraceae bacterium]